MNKYLITVLVPELETEFDIYIPNNKKIGTIKETILKAIMDLTNGTFNKNMNDVRLIDREFNVEYDNNIFVKDSKIKNGTKLVII